MPWAVTPEHIEGIRIGAVPTRNLNIGSALADSEQSGIQIVIIPNRMKNGARFAVS
ncbi:MAG: hypothetical protein K0M48_05920 [Thiobacillus sp.]|nr:hypothetical protein [Thiobacillus sp.]